MNYFPEDSQRRLETAPRGAREVGPQAREKHDSEATGTATEKEQAAKAVRRRRCSPPNEVIEIAGSAMSAVVINCFADNTAGAEAKSPIADAKAYNRCG